MFFFIHSRGQPRVWTDEEMLELMDKINQGYTYMDVMDGTHVPISNLWTRLLEYFILLSCQIYEVNTYIHYVIGRSSHQ